MWFLLNTFSLVVLAPLLANLPRCFRAILNDARIISKDPALHGSYEILYAYPGFWALFWYRLSHALLKEDIPFVSAVVPRLAMAVVRYATAIDIHPGAEISGEGILIDHGAGLVVGETACIGGGVTLYHGVTLGNSGKKLAPGDKRHPTIGDRVVVGAGAKILGNIEIGNDVLVGANSIVTKPVPPNHTAVGVPAKVLCHNAASCKDINGAAICELHRRLKKIEGVNKTTTNSLPEDNISSTDSNKNITVQSGEQSEASVEEEARTSRQTIPIMLPSPRENQPVLAFIHPPKEASEVASDDINPRIALEKTGFSPRGVSDSSVGSNGRGTFILEPDTKRSAVGDILYSLHVLGEHDAVAETPK